MKKMKSHGDGCLKLHALAYSLIARWTSASPTMPPSIESMSGVFAYVARGWLNRYPTGRLLAMESLVYAVATLVALFFLVRLRVGLSYSPENLRLMLTIYALVGMAYYALPPVSFSQVIVTTPTDREIVMTRVFNAPREAIQEIHNEEHRNIESLSAHGA